MAHYVVTGGAGFIGSTIVKALLKEQHTVVVIDNLSTGHRSNLAAVADAITFHEGDIRDEALLRQVCARADYVIHQAAIRAVGRSIDDPLTNHDINGAATVRLLKICQDAQVQRFVFASSSAIYGDTQQAHQREDFLPDPKSPYAVTKITGEYYARVWSELYQLDTVSLRYFNVYGPNQNPESKYSAVIPIFIKQLLTDRPVEIHGDGSQRRDFVYVDDVARAVLQAATCAQPLRGAAYNIGSGQTTSVRELHHTLADMLGSSSPPRYGQRRAGDVEVTCADITKSQKELGYQPTVSLRNGLTQTVAWFRQQI